MFKAPFSFEGRIRRMEYGLSFLLYVIAATIFNGISKSSDTDGPVFFLFIGYITLIWFLWAQGAKRCHDLGNSGWYQLIPFYGLWMLFQEGYAFSNQYGQNPKQPSFSTDNTPSYYEDHPIKQPLIHVSQATQSEEPLPSGLEVAGLQPILKDVANTGGIQTTELEIQQVNYALLQEMLSALRAVKLVQGTSYELNGTVGKVTVQHEKSSQDLLDALYGIVQGIEVLAVGNGTIKVKLK